MSKLRFTDCDKWDDPWYMGLPVAHKCLWHYLCDRCDNAGVWVVNVPLAETQIGQALDWKVALDGMSGRVEVIDGGRKWHLTKFVRFQHPNGLNPNSRPHAQVLRLLSSHEIKERVADSLSDRLSDRLKDKDSPLPLRGSAEGGQSFRQLLAEWGLASAPAAQAEWKTYLSDGVGITSRDELLGFLRWFVGVARKQGAEYRFARHAGEAAARDWKEHHQSKFRQQA